MHPQEIVEAAKVKQNCKSFSDLAELMGLQRMAISRYQRAASAPRGGDLIRLAELSGVSIPEILLAFAEHHATTPAIEREAWQEIRKGYERGKQAL